MIVQHIVSGELVRAIEMRTPFTFGSTDVVYAAGDVVLLRKTRREVVKAAVFAAMYLVIEAPTGEQFASTEPLPPVATRAVMVNEGRP